MNINKKGVTNMGYKDKYFSWLNSHYIDDDMKEELRNIFDEKEIEDRFYQELEFGTGGLRGIIGAGSNRMNIYTVGKATQGLADYLKEKYRENISVAIAYDSRIMSEEFAKTAGEVLAANNIKVNIFKSLHPTPMLSYSTIHLECNAGICVTASHNPKEYNGYKVYGQDGGQITDECAENILKHIKAVENFNEIKKIKFQRGIENGLISYIGDEVDEAYYNKVKDLVIRKQMVKDYAKDLKIIYTPIHGTGNIPVRRVLKELGYENIFVVKEQELPDGNFPTAPYPNPEIHQVFNIALKMAEEINPDIIFGTDPDCDRIGVVVKDNKGIYRVLTGNQMGALLTYYILMSMKENNSIPKNGVVIKTIVTTDMAGKIGEDFNINILEVLTGFKYIGEKIKEFKQNKKNKYIFGFEESYGYLMGDFVRDKDAVIASTIICEMALYYKKQGLTLYDALINLYDKYGYFKEELISMELKGLEGKEKIDKMMHYFRHSITSSLNGHKIIRKIDYKLGTEKYMENMLEKSVELPKSNVIKFIFEDNSWFVVRPSGTEPKIKIYFSVVGSSSEDSENKMNNLKKAVMSIIDIV